VRNDFFFFCKWSSVRRIGPHVDLVTQPAPFKLGVTVFLLRLHAQQAANKRCVINVEFSQYVGMPHHLMSCYFLSLKNNSEHAMKINYNPLRVINLLTRRHPTSPHVMSLSSIKNNSENPSFTSISFVQSPSPLASPESSPTS
jgi:hypothetical protein